MPEPNPLKGIVYRLYERRLLTGILRHPVPRHLGLIQDGHRRYARHAGVSNLEGKKLWDLSLEMESLLRAALCKCILDEIDSQEKLVARIEASIIGEAPLKEDRQRP